MTARDPMSVLRGAVESYLVHDAPAHAKELRESIAQVEALVEVVADVYGTSCESDNAGDDACDPECVTCKIRARLQPFTPPSGGCDGR